MENHSFSEPRPVESSNNSKKPTWQVDLFRHGVEEAIDTLLVNADNLPPRRRKGKVVWKLPDSHQTLPRLGEIDRQRVWELFKEQKKKRRKQLKRGCSINTEEEGTNNRKEDLTGDDAEEDDSPTNNESNVGVSEKKQNGTTVAKAPAADETSNPFENGHANGQNGKDYNSHETTANMPKTDESNGIKDEPLSSPPLPPPPPGFSMHALQEETAALESTTISTTTTFPTTTTVQAPLDAPLQQGLPNPPSQVDPSPLPPPASPLPLPPMLAPCYFVIPPTSTLSDPSSLLGTAVAATLVQTLNAGHAHAWVAHYDNAQAQSALLMGTAQASYRSWAERTQQWDSLSQQHAVWECHTWTVQAVTGMHSCYLVVLTGRTIQPRTGSCHYCLSLLLQPAAAVIVGPQSMHLAAAAGATGTPLRFQIIHDVLTLTVVGSIT